MEVEEYESEGGEGGELTLVDGEGLRRDVECIGGGKYDNVETVWKK